MARGKNISGVADGPTAVGHEFDTINSFATDGAKLLSIKNAGVEKFSVSKEGLVLTPANSIVVLPHEGAVGINAAIVALKAKGGGIVQLTKGTYELTEAISHYYQVNNITIQGLGDATVLKSVGSVSGGVNIVLTGWLDNANLDPVTKGDTSVYITNPALYTRFLDEDWLIIAGVNTVDEDGSFVHYEVRRIDGDPNPSTGEIPLDRPTNINVDTNISIRRIRDGHNLTVRNFKMIDPDSHGTQPLQLGGIHGRMENITIEDYNHGPTIAYAINFTVDNVRTRNTKTNHGIHVNTSVQGIVKNCYFENSVTNGDGNQSAIEVLGSSYISIDNNIVESVTAGMGIEIEQCNHSSVINNSVNRVWRYSMSIGGLNRDVCFNNNFITPQNTNGNAFECSSGGHRYAITNNVVRDVAQGYRSQSGQNHMIANNIFDTVSPYSAVSIQQDAGKEFNIFGNIFYNCGRGVSVSRANYIGINNNLMNGASSGLYGISIACGSVSYDCDHNVVSGNLCQNHTSNGIHLNDEYVIDSLITTNNCDGDGIEESTGSGNIFGLNKE